MEPAPLTGWGLSMGSSFSTDPGVSRSLDESWGVPLWTEGRRKSTEDTGREDGEAFGESQGEGAGPPRGP